MSITTRASGLARREAPRRGDLSSWRCTRGRPRLPLFPQGPVHDRASLTLLYHSLHSFLLPSLTSGVSKPLRNYLRDTHTGAPASAPLAHDHTCISRATNSRLPPPQSSPRNPATALQQRLPLSALARINSIASCRASDAVSLARSLGRSRRNL